MRDIPSEQQISLNFVSLFSSPAGKEVLKYAGKKLTGKTITQIL